MDGGGLSIWAITAMCLFNHRANSLPDVGIVVAPRIASGRIALCFGHLVHRRISPLDMPRFLQPT